MRCDADYAVLGSMLPACAEACLLPQLGAVRQCLSGLLTDCVADMRYKDSQISNYWILTLCLVEPCLAGMQSWYCPQPS